MNPMDNVPPQTAVDRPCDIHFIECKARNLKELPEGARCKMWDTVPRKERGGVSLMNCPLECCYEANKKREMCNLKYWEDRKYGESLWPIP